MAVAAPRPLRALAAAAPAAVFVAADGENEAAAQSLAIRDGTEVVPTPRHATVLLVAGAIPDRAHAALRRLHDQMPHPRATVLWRGAAGRPVLPVGEGAGNASEEQLPAIRRPSTCGC